MTETSGFPRAPRAEDKPINDAEKFEGMYYNHYSSDRMSSLVDYSSMEHLVFLVCSVRIGRYQARDPKTIATLAP